MTAAAGGTGRRLVLLPPRLDPTGLLPPPAGARVQAVGGWTMGTSWSVRAVLPPGADLEPLVPALEAELDRVIRQMSGWDPASDLCRFNSAPAGSRVQVPEGLREVLVCGMEVASDTGGAFDPTAGALVALWGFGPAPRRSTPPLAEEVEEARARCGRRRLDPADLRPLRPGTPALLTQPGGLSLDLHGIAKGYAVDRLSLRLERAGLSSHLVEIGGELRGQGIKPDLSPWWVGLDDPGGSAGVPLVRVALHGLSIATSGDRYHAFASGGRRYSHTLDPRTGWPVPEGLTSVTVLDRSCMRADALATALLVLGPEAGPDFAASRGIPALFLFSGAAGANWLPSPALLAMEAEVSG